MVNPYSAVIYGVNPGGPNYPFSSDNNPANHPYDDWRRVDSLTQTAGDRAEIPMAGVISTHAFLDAVSDDAIEHQSEAGIQGVRTTSWVPISRALASRDGQDLDSVIGDVPTYEDPQCTVCHDVMDPVAGLFHKAR